MKKDIFRFIKPLYIVDTKSETTNHLNSVFKNIKDQYVEHYQNYTEVVEDITKMYELVNDLDTSVNAEYHPVMLTDDLIEELREGINDVVISVFGEIVNSSNNITKGSRCNAIAKFTEALFKSLTNSSNSFNPLLYTKVRAEYSSQEKGSLGDFLLEVNDTWPKPGVSTMRGNGVLTKDEVLNTSPLDPLKELMEKIFEADPVEGTLFARDLVIFRQELYSHITNNVVPKLVTPGSTANALYQHSFIIEKIAHIIAIIDRRL